MNTLVIILLVLLGAAALAVFWVIGLYNGLVTLRNRYKNGFSQIDVQLKRRYDLIPNLVETAKTYMAHEKDTLEAVIQARNQASSARQAAASAPADSDALKSLNQAEAGLTAAMSRFSIVQEAYPDLKANQNMMQLTEELTSTENKIAFARQAYNDAVMNYNNRREMFPSSIIANSFNFQAAQLLEIETPAKREAVKVSFT